MADERDRIRARLGLPPLSPKVATDSSASVSMREPEREKFQGMTAPTPKAEPSITLDPYYVRDPKTGLSPAQVEAQKVLKETVATRQQLGLGGTVVAEPGSAGRIVTTPSVTAIVAPTTTTTTTVKPTTEATTVIVSPTTVVTDTSVATPTLAKDTFRNTLALFFGAGEASKPWVEQLYNVVSKYYKTGSTIDESFNLALQDARNNPALSEFTRRFKGVFALQDMRQAGKPVTVPTIAEYVASQAGLAEYLTASGLGGLATEEFTGDVLGKGVSVSTAADRLAKVFDRIDRAPTTIKNTISRYFPTVDRSTLARTLLLGEKGTKQLVDELAGYEVLSAAEAQGIAATGVAPKMGGITEQRAQEYARMGETYESIMPKLSQVALAAPRASQLSEFSKRQDIGQVGVEQAIISRAAPQLAELEKLSIEEEARFAGKAGRAELGLASQRRAQRAF